MSTRTKTTTNGRARQEPAVTDAEITTGTEVQVQPLEEDLEGGLEGADTNKEPAEVLTDDNDTEVEAGMEASATGCTESTAVDTDLATPPPVGTPTHLSKQEAIAQVNTANHDLVTLLEPLLTSAITQKRLAALMVSQIGLSEAEGDAWLAFVKQFLETKRKASQSLVRSLIDQA